MKKTVYILSYKVTVFGAFDGKDNGIVYAHFAEDDAQEVYEKLSLPKPYLAAVEGIDWERDLTPDKAKKAFRGGRNFAGGAKNYLKILCDTIIPKTEKECDIAPSFRAIAGYSLAGLFAVYSLYNCDIFNRAASVSGSLWFNGFYDSIKNITPIGLPEKIYFSLGDKEKFTKSERMAKVEDCTLKTVELFKSFGSNVKFEFNSGGHFKDVEERIAKGIDFISKV